MNWMNMISIIIQVINMLLLFVGCYIIILLVILLNRGIKALNIYINNNEDKKE